MSRTKRTRELAEKLTNDGFEARAFNGKMDSSEKQENQEAFINDKVQVIVATSAFGMGVDKSNVKLVIHYDISDSLENYVQEAGRAGRDQSLNAECYVLFNDSDLDKHFILLNQTKLSISEIQQVWKAIKDLTHTRPDVCCSPLEIARQAGWDESVSDIETRVKTAIQALENAGYIKRGKNTPRIYATSLLVKNMMEAEEKIGSSSRFENDSERSTAKRIIKSLISSKNIAKAGSDDAESRVDYLADRLGIEKKDIIHSIQKMREEGLLSDAKDLTAYIKKSDTENKSNLILRKFLSIEVFLLDYINADKLTINYKALNDAALSKGIKESSVNAIKTLFYYWTIRGYIQKEQNQSTDTVIIKLKMDMKRLKQIRKIHYSVSAFIINYLFQISSGKINSKEEVLVGFSVLELLGAYRNQLLPEFEIREQDIEESLLFLAKVGAMKLDGGFLVLYSGMKIKRLELDSRIKYKQEDYRLLNDFYRQKIQQIHIVGEYANMMVRDYSAALQFVNDYFQMDYKEFLSKYFSDERRSELERNITPQKFKQIFDTLSKTQLEIISDDNSRYIVVSAGPGSGKTRVLVHKLASLLLLEDVKHEQLLMLTFSRAAAIEFKQKLYNLIGNAANFIEIKTFHSYSFDLLGKIGSIKESENVVCDAVKIINEGDVDLGKITKTVLVIDEAQDMDIHEFQLVEALMRRNDDMRVIAVGDDDQNIFQFRGSDSKFFKSFVVEYGAKQYSLIDNYRSCQSIVSFSNQFAKSISERIKRNDIIAVTSKMGEVKLIKHSGTDMEQALVDDFLSAKVDGSTCLLTSTNNEALVILGILKHLSIPAKLIQSNDGFDIYDIMEIRSFLKKLSDENTSPVISTESWNNAVKALQEQYRDSSCLPLVMNILNTFDETYNKKYRTDLEVFLHEARIADFYSNEKNVVTISTMHKSKGMEFDNVYILMSYSIMQTDEEKRVLYVGMTRAKNRLHIHYCGDVLDGFSDYASIYKIDKSTYPKPAELIFQLSHRDVYLDFFKGKKLTIQRLRSGMHLSVKGERLFMQAGGKCMPVLQFSQKAIGEMNKLKMAGYVPYDSQISFICAWRGKDDTDETDVILADIFFRLQET